MIRPSKVAALAVPNVAPKEKIRVAVRRGRIKISRRRKRRSQVITSALTAAARKTWTSQRTQSLCQREVILEQVVQGMAPRQQL
jgi:hypothetical protein